MPLGEMPSMLAQKTVEYLPNLVLALLVVVGGYIAGKTV